MINEKRAPELRVLALSALAEPFTLGVAPQRCPYPNGRCKDTNY